MDFAILTNPRGPIDLDVWKRIIATHPSLEQVPDRTGIDPFTNQPTLFSGVGKAYYVVNGEKAGNLAFDDGQIKATHVPRAILDELADLLDAEVVEADWS